MRKIFFLIFLIAAKFTYSQLARLTFFDKQKYTMNIKRSVVVGTPFSKAIRSVYLNNIVPDKDGGYLKYYIVKANSGSTSKGPYMHFMNLDKNLTIKSEKETYLFPQGENSIEPVIAFEQDKKLNLITASSDKDYKTLSLAYWQFSLVDFSIVKQNIGLTTFPFNKAKYYDFKFTRSADSKTFGLIVLEEGGKKDSVIAHSLFLTEGLNTTYNGSLALPFATGKGRINSVKITPDGSIFALFDYVEGKNDDYTINTMLIAAKKKQQLIAFEHKGEPLINCAFNLSPTGNVMVAGLIQPSKKGYTPGFVAGHLEDVKFEIDKEEIFTKALLSQINDAGENGLEKEYYVRAIIGRPSGAIDIILNYCKQKETSRNQGGDYYTVTEVSDMVVLSYDKNKLIATNIFPRALEHWEPRTFHVTNNQAFSTPEVFTIGNDLYIMQLDNPSNLLGSKKKLKRTDFTDCSMVLSKIDAAYKITQQELVKFKKKTDFPSYFEFDIEKIDDRHYIFVSDKFRVFTKKVKSSSALVEIY
jgi:hypothetical protein